MRNCANKILLRNRKLNPGLWDVNIKTERTTKKKKKKKIDMRAHTHARGDYGLIRLKFSVSS